MEIMERVMRASSWVLDLPAMSVTSKTAAVVSVHATNIEAAWATSKTVATDMVRSSH